MSPEIALTIEQAAARLQMNEQVLRRWIRDGRIPAVKLGRHWRLTESTVDKVLTGALEVAKAPTKAKAGKATKKRKAKR